MKKIKCAAAYLLVILLALTQPMGLMSVVAAETIPYIDENGDMQSISSDQVTVIDSLNISSYTHLTAGWYLIRGEVVCPSSNVDIDYSPTEVYIITTEGEVNLILEDDSELKFPLCHTLGGIAQVVGDEEMNLSIYAQSTGAQMGKITGGRANRIGGKIDDSDSGGSITINGGDIDLISTKWGGYVIGGSEYAVTINGGDISVSAESNGCIGIGGMGSQITINGGTINARGYNYGVGIGGNGSNITINGGIVNSETDVIAPGISTGGTGYITINGGTVTADGGDGAADMYAMGLIVRGGAQLNLQEYGLRSNYEMFENCTVTDATGVFSGTYPPAAEISLPDEIDVSEGHVVFFPGDNAGTNTVMFSNASGAAVTKNIPEATPVTITSGGTQVGYAIATNQGVHAEVVLKDANIVRSRGGAFLIENTSTADITLEGDNRLHSGDYLAGLTVFENGEVIIGGDGSLDAEGGLDAAGIGIGGYSNGESCGTITINSGTITAQGGPPYSGHSRGAGIGGSSGKITINGGNITATGGGNTAGIQTNSLGYITINDGIIEAYGEEGNCAIGLPSATIPSVQDNTTILITGGDVTATGGAKASGTGGSGINAGVSGEIIIEGGTVTAIGGDGTNGGSGIGMSLIGGDLSSVGTNLVISSSTIIIEDSTVIATGGSGTEMPGAGIGNAMKQSRGGKLMREVSGTIHGADITITNSTVTATGGIGGGISGNFNGQSTSQIEMHAGSVTINSGIIEATAADGAHNVAIGGSIDGAVIQSGEEYVILHPALVEINGGSVKADSVAGAPFTSMVDGGKPVYRYSYEKGDEEETEALAFWTYYEAPAVDDGTDVYYWLPNRAPTVVAGEETQSGNARAASASGHGALTYTADASLWFEDFENSTLTYTLESYEDTATLNPTTGAFSYSVDLAQPGDEVDFVISANDGEDDSVSNVTVTVTVHEPIEGYSVAVTSEGLSSLKVGQPVSGGKVIYTLSAPGYETSITEGDFAVSGLPAGLSQGTVTRISDSVVEVSITGAPTTVNVNTVNITYATSIPSGNFSGATNPVTASGTAQAGPVAKGDGTQSTDAVTVTYSPTLTVADAVSSFSEYTFSNTARTLAVADSGLEVTGYKDNADSTNYNQDSITVTITVNRAVPTSALLDFTIENVAYDGEEKPVSVTAKAAVDGLGSITVLYNSATSAPVNVGTYAVSVELAQGENYEAKTLSLGTFDIEKSTPTAPSITGVSPTVFGGSDGKITGFPPNSTAYEYLDTGVGGSSYLGLTVNSQGEAIGFSAGIYQVRLKETSNTYPSDYATVTIVDPPRINSVVLTLRLDGKAYSSHGKTFTFRQGGVIKGTATSPVSTVTANLPDGTYNIFDGSNDTGLTVTADGGAALTLEYFTVSYRVSNSGAASGSKITATYAGKTVASGSVVLSGKALVITATGSGAASGAYVYTWSGAGTRGEATASLSRTRLVETVNALCTVTGAAVTYRVSYSGGGAQGTLPPSALYAPGETFAVPAGTGLTYTSKIFLGWSDGAITYTQGSIYTMPGGAVTLTAMWEDTYDIEGQILDEDTSSPVGAGISARLVRGNTNFGSPVVTDDQGRFRFSSVPNGLYNIVVERDLMRTTQLVEVDGGNISGVQVSIPSGNRNSTVKVEGETTPDIMVGDLEKQFAASSGSDGVFTPADDLISTSGGLVELRFTAEEKQESEIGDDSSKIREKMTEDSGTTLGLILDLSVIKSVIETPTDPDPQEILTNISEMPKLLTIIIPLSPEMQGKDRYEVYRVHEGVAEQLFESDDPDEERFELTRNEQGKVTGITIYAYRFSTYALAFADNSDLCDVLAVTEPENATITGAKITAQADYETQSQRVSLAVSPKATWKLYSDSTRTNEISNKTMTLAIGKNTGYITVTAESGASKLYTIEITRSAEPKDRSGISKFLDTVNHKAYINGFEDGTFRPNSGMTRAEAAVMLYRVLIDNSATQKASFEDVPENAWYSKAVNTLAAMGIIAGYPDGTFKPNKTITRAEFTTLVSRFTKGAQDGKVFKDVPRKHWAYKAIQAVSAYGWVNGYSDGTFRPNNIITRAEATTMLNNALGRKADKTAIKNEANLKTFKDVPQTHWAYYIIAEAANTHKFEKKDDVEIWK